MIHFQKSPNLLKVCLCDTIINHCAPTTSQVSHSSIWLTYCWEILIQSNLRLICLLFFKPRRQFQKRNIRSVFSLLIGSSHLLFTPRRVTSFCGGAPVISRCMIGSSALSPGRCLTGGSVDAAVLWGGRSNAPRIRAETVRAGSHVSEDHGAVTQG